MGMHGSYVPLDKFAMTQHILHIIAALINYSVSFPTIDMISIPELHLRGCKEDNSILFFLFLIENICCGPSLEPSRRDGSNDGSQNMFLWRNMENYPEIITFTHSYLVYCLY